MRSGRLSRFVGEHPLHVVMAALDQVRPAEVRWIVVPWRDLGLNRVVERNGRPSEIDVKVVRPGMALLTKFVPSRYDKRVSAFRDVEVLLAAGAGDGLKRLASEAMSPSSAGRHWTLPSSPS